MVLVILQKTTRPATSGRRTAPSTRWYRAVVGGYEVAHTPEGDQLAPEFVIEGFNLDLPDTYLGLGTRDRIEAEAREQFPSKDLIDFWPLSNPPVDEF